MASRMLQSLGVLAVVGLAATGIGSLWIVKDRIQVTVQDDAAGPRPDPLELVRDDLDQLHRDLAAIAKGLDDNLGQVGGALQDASRQRGVLRAEVAKLAAELARAPAPPVEVAIAPTTPMAETAQPATTTTEPTPSEPNETPSAATSGRSFLSFKLPSTNFAFDQPLHYRVLAKLSRVGFDAKSTLHDFSGVTSKIEGDLHANLAETEHAWHGEISCDAASLYTGVDGRDEAMREHLDTAHHPRIRFEVTGFRATDGSTDIPAAKTAGTAVGRMTIHGVTRPFEMPVEVSTDASRRIIISGQTPAKLTDFDIEVPSQLGLINMQDEVSVWIELRARAIGAAEATPDEH